MGLIDLSESKTKLDAAETVADNVSSTAIKKVYAQVLYHTFTHVFFIVYSAVLPV